MKIPFFLKMDSHADFGGSEVRDLRRDEDHVFVEQFKALRAKLEYKLDKLNCKVVAITSAVAGEGKTLLTANVAENLASAGRRKVLLIDADLRKSDLARAMG